MPIASQWQEKLLAAVIILGETNDPTSPDDVNNYITSGCFHTAFTNPSHSGWVRFPSDPAIRDAKIKSFASAVGERCPVLEKHGPARARGARNVFSRSTASISKRYLSCHSADRPSSCCRDVGRAA